MKEENIMSENNNVSEVELLQKKIKRLERIQMLAIHIMTDKQNDKLMKIVKEKGI